VAVLRLLPADSYFLKFEGQVFAGIFFVGYLVKWGVAWHDAGKIFDLTSVKFSAVYARRPRRTDVHAQSESPRVRPAFAQYWDMILILYTGLGIFLTIGSVDPQTFKPLLSWSMWVANLAHGIVAFIHCFTDRDQYGLNGPGESNADAHFGGFNNLDKLFIAVPLWFGMFFGNLYFSKKCFGDCNLPWNLVNAQGGTKVQVQPA
jgi:hypothetical protein